MTIAEKVTTIISIVTVLILLVIFARNSLKLNNKKIFLIIFLVLSLIYIIAAILFSYENICPAIICLISSIYFFISSFKKRERSD